MLIVKRQTIKTALEAYSLRSAPWPRLVCRVMNIHVDKIDIITRYKYNTPLHDKMLDIFYAHSRDTDHQTDWKIAACLEGIKK